MLRTLLLILLIIQFSIVSAKKKPNILWITIEDTSPQFIGCYGNANAKTPFVDRLAEEGVRFTNAYSTGTVCSPSRSCIITGVKTYKTGTGNHRSNYPVPDFIKGFPYYLQQQGYYTTNNRKTDYNVANAGEFTQEAWDESSGKAGWWNRKPGQPFFAVFNFFDSHQSRTMTEPYSWYQKNVLLQLDKEEQIGEDEFEMPPFYRDSPEMRHHFARVYNSIKLTDNKIGDLLNRLEKDGLRDSTIIFFYADHGEGIPRGKTNGICLGYRVPFVVWVPEMYKHLSPWGTGGVINDEMIDFEDLAPTVLALSGAPIPDHLKGRVLMGEKTSPKADYLFLSNDRSDNGIDKVRTVVKGKYLYSRNFMPFMPEARYIRYMEIGEIKQQMRTDLKNGLLDSLSQNIFMDRPTEFLFNIEEDGWETRNLAEDEDYNEILEELRTALWNEIMRSKDILMLPEYEIAKISEYTTPYEYRMNETNYPVESVAKAALLSGFRGDEVAKKQVALLKDPNPFIRYWAIVGLRSQPEELWAKYHSEISAATKDNYPPVALTAAAIDYEIDFNQNSAELLKRYISGDNPELALMAVNYLLYSGHKEEFAGLVKQVWKEDGGEYKVKAACVDFLGSLGLVPNTGEYRD